MLFRSRESTAAVCAEHIEQRERHHDLLRARHRHGRGSGKLLRAPGMNIPSEGAGASATETVLPPSALLLPAFAKATSRSLRALTPATRDRAKPFYEKERLRLAGPRRIGDVVRRRPEDDRAFRGRRRRRRFGCAQGF